MRLLKLGLVVGSTLLWCAGCEPSTNQAQSVSASPALPPAPPPPPGSGTASVESGSRPAAPKPAPTIESGSAVLPTLSPLAAYENVEQRIDAVLRQVTDGPSANAAAADLAPLTVELKQTLRPYLAALAAMPDAARNGYLQRKMQEAISQKSSGNEVNHKALIDLAREPGNEPFKAALIAMFQTMNAEGSTGIKRSATRMLERLQRP